MSADLSTLLGRVRDVLEPFDDALGEDEVDYPDDTKVTLKFGACTDYSLKLGDLRRAREVARVLEDDQYLLARAEQEVGDG